VYYSFILFFVLLFTVHMCAINTRFNECNLLKYVRIAFVAGSLIPVPTWKLAELDLSGCFAPGKERMVRGGLECKGRSEVERDR